LSLSRRYLKTKLTVLKKRRFYHKTSHPLVNQKGKWDHQQYSKFRDERKQPFYDLAAWIQTEGVTFNKIVDLGCGNGELTSLLQDHLKAKSALGIDSSVDMLESCKKYESEKVKFKQVDIDSFFKESSGEVYDLVFSNATLHWLNNHEKLFKSIDNIVNKEKGQIAIQVPINNLHISQSIIPEILSQPKYAKHVKVVYKNPVQPPEFYSQLLHDLGYKSQKVFINIYPHLLSSAGEMAEWTKGSTLSYYRSYMPKEVFDQFFEDYKKTLVSKVKDSSPFLFTFKKIFKWGTK